MKIHLKCNIFQYERRSFAILFTRIFEKYDVKQKKRTSILKNESDTVLSFYRKLCKKKICSTVYQTRGSLAKKKIMFLHSKNKAYRKDIKVSAKVLRKCFVSSLILLWQPKSAQSALSSMVFKI